MPLPSRNQIIATVFTSIFPQQLIKDWFRDMESLTQSTSACLIDWKRQFINAASALQTIQIGDRFTYAVQSTAFSDGKWLPLYNSAIQIGHQLEHALQQLTFNDEEWQTLCKRDFDITTEAASAKNVYIGTFMTALVMDFDLLELDPDKTFKIIDNKVNFKQSIVDQTINFLSKFDDHLWAQAYLYFLATTTYKGAHPNDNDGKLVADYRLKHFKQSLTNLTTDQANSLPAGMADYLMLHKLADQNNPIMPTLVAIHERLKNRSFSASQLNIGIGALIHYCGLYLDNKPTIPYDTENQSFAARIEENFDVWNKNTDISLSPVTNQILEIIYLFWLHRNLSNRPNFRHLYILAKYSFEQNNMIARDYFCQLFSADDKSIGGFVDLSITPEQYNAIRSAVSESQPISENACRQICKILATVYQFAGAMRTRYDSIDYRTIVGEFQQLAKSSTTSELIVYGDSPILTETNNEQTHDLSSNLECS